MIKFDTSPGQDSARQKVRLIVNGRAEGEQAQKKAQLEFAKATKTIKADAIPAINSREKRDLEGGKGIKMIDILSQ